VDSPAQRDVDVLVGLADAREEALPGVTTGGDDAAQLALADHIVATAQIGQRAHDRRVGVRLDGKANEMGQRRQSLLELLKVIGQGVLGIDVERGAELLDERCDRYPFAEELPTNVVEIMHEK